MIENHVMLACGDTILIKGSMPKMGTVEYCRKHHRDELVTRRVHPWTIRCVHIEHSMTRTYNIDKEYAINRALAHTRKYGSKHICMVYQKVDFDGTMEFAFPEVKGQQELLIDIGEDYADITGKPTPYEVYAAVALEGNGPSKLGAFGILTQPASREEAGF